MISFGAKKPQFVKLTEKKKQYQNFGLKYQPPSLAKQFKSQEQEKKYTIEKR